MEASGLRAVRYTPSSLAQAAARGIANEPTLTYKRLNYKRLNYKRQFLVK
jgi:hypothetical protein